jgi:hypothetical protein
MEGFAERRGITNASNYIPYCGAKQGGLGQSDLDSRDEHEMEFHALKKVKLFGIGNRRAI